MSANGVAELTRTSLADCLPNREAALTHPLTRAVLTNVGSQTEVYAPASTVGSPFIDALKRRWARERRRRKIGRAYDMALEIARVVPLGSKVLDVGCGNGFIAHHLSAMLATRVIGIDVMDATEAPIDYRGYNGVHFPLKHNSVDAVLLCYVLHHAQDVRAVLSEARRVLCAGGQVIVYEDNPQSRWDKAVCWIHDRQWRDRTGPCTFRSESEWLTLFESLGFEIIRERQLSRWRNLTHPVSRSFYVLRQSSIHRACLNV
jgi:ubiquinone/menaquinone biosynthesis C-methylase UbiE